MTKGAAKPNLETRPAMIAPTLHTGMAALSRYTGTWLTLFMAQTVVGLVALFAAAQVLAATFAHRPMFDDGVAGDLVSLIWAVQHGKTALAAVSWLLVGVVLMWVMASWFLAGGLTHVLATRPEGRAATANAFGAGANTFLSYAMLAVLASPLLLLVGMIWFFCIDAAYPRVLAALTMAQLVGALLLAFGPALLALMVVWTLIDYARIDLTLYRTSHELGALRALGRAVGLIVRRPGLLLHAGAGWLLWLAIGLGYALLVADRPLLGASGALTLFAIRSSVNLLRLGVKIGVLAGQVEVAKDQPPPPRPALAE